MGSFLHRSRSATGVKHKQSHCDRMAWRVKEGTRKTEAEDLVVVDELLVESLFYFYLKEKVKEIVKLSLLFSILRSCNKYY